MTDTLLKESLPTYLPAAGWKRETIFFWLEVWISRERRIDIDWSRALEEGERGRGGEEVWGFRKNVFKGGSCLFLCSFHFSPFRGIACGGQRKKRVLMGRCLRLSGVSWVCVQGGVLV